MGIMEMKRKEEVYLINRYELLQYIAKISLAGDYIDLSESVDAA